MKLSIVLSTQPASFSALAYKGELERNLAKIAELGYDGVELAVRDPRLLDVAELQKKLAAHGLQVPAIGTGQAYGEEGLSFSHPDPHIRDQAVERIQHQIDLAAHFDAVVILGLIRGRAAEAGVEPEQAYTWMVEAIRNCAEYADTKNVRLALEPINRYETDLINTVAQGLALVEDVGSQRFGLLLDTFHMNIEEASMEQSIAAAADRIFHFHVADSNRWHPGAGHLDFGRIVAALQGAGYQGFLSAEILPQPDPDTAARKALEQMRAILA